MRRNLATRAFGPDDVQVTSSLTILLRDTIQLQDADDTCRRCLKIRWAPQLPCTSHGAVACCQQCLEKSCRQVPTCSSS